MTDKDTNISGSEMGKDTSGPYLYRGDSVASFTSVGSSVFKKGDSWVPNLQLTLSNNLKMPLFGLGTFQSKKDDAYMMTLYALKLGYRHIDTARVYRNEVMIGRAIKDSRIPRNEFFVTSKLSPADHGYQSALEAFMDSLEDLGMNYIDLYLIHWPACQGIPGTSPQNLTKRKESWKALERLYKDGKAKAIGVSNYTVKHLKEMLEYAEVLPHVNQVELHPHLQQKELIEFCKEHNIVVFPYSPLGQGRLLECDDIIKISKKKGRSPASVLLRWAVQKGLGCIPKTVKAGRLLENARIFDWELTDAEMEAIDALDQDVHYCWDPTNIA